MFVHACCLLAGLSSLSRAMSLTRVALLKLGCILMSETVNSWRKKSFVMPYPNRKWYSFYTCLVRQRFRSGSDIVLPYPDF